MKRDLHLERLYPHPPSLVWRVLTERELLAEWLMENDFVAEVGHVFTFRTDPAPGFDGIVHAEVVALERERKISISWRGGSIDTVVTFRLEDAIVYARPGTRLVLEHTGFEGLPAILTSFILDAGWRSMGRKKVAPLLDRLARGEPARAPASEPAKQRRLWSWLGRLLSPVLRGGKR